MKLLVIPYSIVCYLFGVASLVCLIFFVGDLWLPWTINAASPVSPQLTGLAAVLANLGLVLAWSMQHSVMADPKFKRGWTKIVPTPIERSTYVVVVGVMTFAMLVLWSPLPTVIWDMSGTVAGRILLAGFFFGWAIVLISTFLINHFHLFGLQQAFKTQRTAQPNDGSFVTPLLYKLVRHPMMAGALIAMWCVPTLTVGRLLINIAMTAYILIGVRHEERTLVAELGQEYQDYQAETPMLIPGMGGKKD